MVNHPLRASEKRAVSSVSAAFGHSTLMRHPDEAGHGAFQINIWVACDRIDLLFLLKCKLITSQLLQNRASVTLLTVCFAARKGLQLFAQNICESNV